MYQQQYYNKEDYGFTIKQNHIKVTFYKQTEAQIHVLGAKIIKCANYIFMVSDTGVFISLHHYFLKLIKTGGTIDHSFKTVYSLPTIYQICSRCKNVMCPPRILVARR